MMGPHRLMRARELSRATSITRRQYSSGAALMLSDAHMNRTWSMSIPDAFHTSMKYSPTTRIFLRSPPSLSLSAANQSATQNTKSQPEEVNLLTLTAFWMPCAMCMRPDGSKPS
ncbi:hypothetical protein BU14_0231s0017 [Porphyra umbilicalis]|uniref:Uncharacterized protein n=1 Tax=Porphyra umbilicalis TaxID=2786 RepID=A0A1X6P4J3_PORUM|nr:hypothetical protein BU14_0231s0017 [Porphyra umbilicalis]|eukprot:OSX75563.1 hypothetical protein BU14_0231s0017 [Porphyra umbilicalis]